jgi:hypothetical protein
LHKILARNFRHIFETFIINPKGKNMKTKSVLLSVTLIMVMAVAANAQGFQLGVKGGANLVQEQGRSFDNGFRFGYSLGGFAEIKFTKNWGIQPELLWNEYSTRTAATADEVYTDLGTNQSITLNYLSVPVLLSFTPAKIISLQFGPQFGILLNQNESVSQNTTEAFKKGDISIVAGAQLNLAWVKLGARYYQQLNNADNLGTVDTWTAKGFQVYLGIRIL